MKSTVETLEETKVTLTVEIPYEEFKPSLDAAYKEIAKQVNVPGFRRGKVPAPVIDRKVGRIVVIEEAVNKALPELYRQGIAQADLRPMGSPDIEVTEIPNATGENGGQLKLVATVEVRPNFDIPDITDVQLEVDAVKVSDEDVEEELNSLRTRFATLKDVERAAGANDYVNIDMEAYVAGTLVDQVAGTSYQVGSGKILDGADEAITGLAAGESATFTAVLPGGANAGEEAEVKIVVNSVKEQELPEADDDFAQLASEHDTIEELRNELREQLGEYQRTSQAVKARELLLEQLRDMVEFPLPAGVVDAEVEARLEDVEAGDEDKERVTEEVRGYLRDQVLLDKLAEIMAVSVSQQELIEFVVQTSQAYGMEPANFLRAAEESGRIPMFVAEIARNKSLAQSLRKVTIKDTDGTVLDLSDFIGKEEDEEEIEAESEIVADGE